MMMIIGETMDNPDMKVGKSKCLELKPLFGRPKSESPHNVCCRTKQYYTFEEDNPKQKYKSI